MALPLDLCRIITDYSDPYSQYKISQTCHALQTYVNKKCICLINYDHIWSFHKPCYVIKHQCICKEHCYYICNRYCPAPPMSHKCVCLEFDYYRPYKKGRCVIHTPEHACKGQEGA